MTASWWTTRRTSCVAQTKALPTFSRTNLMYIQGANQLKQQKILYKQQRQRQHITNRSQYIKFDQVPSPGRYNEQYKIFESHSSAVCAKAPRKIRLDYNNYTDPGPGQYDVTTRPSTAIQHTINSTYRYRQKSDPVVESEGKSFKNAKKIKEMTEEHEIEAGDLHINYSQVYKSEPRIAFPRAGSSQTYRRV